MYFTKEDILKIQQALSQLGVKDSELQETSLPKWNDYITIVQDNKNKKVSVQKFLNQFVNESFINLTAKYDTSYVSIKEAIKDIPATQRKKGLLISFIDINKEWRLYQFKGELSQFNNYTLWDDVFNLEKYVINSLLPDEEDITITDKDSNGNSKLKFKDKKYDPSTFSGMGHKILRKNIVRRVNNDGTIDYINYLSANEFSDSNTIYEIKYDFDLNGKDIQLLDNCVLLFKGGSIDNGTLILNNTIINSNSFCFKQNLQIEGILCGQINPIHFGIIPNNSTEQIQKDNWDALYRVFWYANSLDVNVDWTLFNNLNVYINIYKDSQIQLNEGKTYDFCECNFIVINTTNVNYSFLYINKSFKFQQIIDLKSVNFDNTDLSALFDTNKKYLVQFIDDNIWTPRTGYDTNHTRKDITIVNAGMATTLPCYSYMTASTSLRVLYREITNNPTKILNLKLHRRNGPTKFKFIQIEGIANLILQNIFIYTENSTTLSNDVCINIINCSKVNLDNITIENLYEADKTYAYGIALDNCSMLFINKFNSYNNNWGITGNNNLNQVYVSNSHINRFDVHCYGKNITFDNCVFYKLYNQFSSVFGSIVFNSCSFINHEPILIEGSYNAYTDFKIIFNDCNFNGIGDSYHLVRTHQLYELTAYNNRPELAQRYLPYIEVNNCTTNCKYLYIFHDANNESYPIKGNDININNLSNTKETLFYIRGIRSNKLMTIENQISINIKNCNLNKDKFALHEKYKSPYLTFQFQSQDIVNIIFENCTIFYIVQNYKGSYKITYKNCVIDGFRYINLTQTNIKTKTSINDCILHLTNTDDNNEIYIDDTILTNCILIPYQTNTLITSNNIGIIKNCKAVDLYNIYKDSQENDYTVFYKIPFDTTVSGIIQERVMQYIYTGKRFDIPIEPKVSITHIDLKTNIKTITTDKSVYMSPGIGTSDNRPLGYKGYTWYDTDLKKEIIYNGTEWVNKDGSSLKNKGTTEERPTTALTIGFVYEDTTLNKLIMWNGTKWINALGNNADILTKGTTEQRPTLTANDEGFQYYDTTLHKPIWWNGTQWIDGTNTPIE